MTDCDFFAHWSHVSVLASGGRLGRQTTLFSYTPYRYDDPGPDVVPVDGNRIVISIPAVSSVGLQLRSRSGTAIEYHIGTIEYPARPAE